MIKGSAGRGGASRVVWRAAAVGAALLAGMATPGAVLAQADPAATVLQQNEQRARDLAAASASGTEAVVSTPAQRADLPPAGGPTLTLTSVAFEPPSAFLSQAELDAIVKPYLGHKVDFRAISSLVRDVNDLYQAKGIVTAGAVLPPQKLADGELKVQLVEGRQGVVSIVGAHRTDNAFLLDHVTLTRGDGVVDVKQAGTDINWFNKTHQAQMSLLLQPGAAFGLTDLTLGITEPPQHTLQFFLDNQGVASTGSTQWGASYQDYGLIGRDDRLMAYATASMGSLAGTVTYDLPVHRSGTRVSLTQTLSGIKVIDGPTRPLDITGRSSATTLTLSQPVYVDASWTVLALASASHGRSQSWAADVPLVDITTNKAALGFSLGYSKDGSSFSMQPQLIRVDTDDPDFGGGWIATAFANLAVPLPADLTLVARGSAQYTPDSLLPGSLLFQIGGPNSVRGYPSDGVGGDSGYFVQAELHHPLSQLAEGLGAYAFADFGEVFSTFPARTSMASLGAGVTMNWSTGVSLDVALGAPVLKTLAYQSDYAIYARLTGSPF